ncbi:McrC family protein [Vibrio crassostreae]|uniref:McrC family protein n=1 Tax=Vibrio crassostreae TaxID=246167 RepID=UPI001B3178CA|nr:McrC family protein [Vibrio crassostreae]
MKAKRRYCIREFGYLLEGRGLGENTLGVPQSAFRYLQSLILKEPDKVDFGPFLQLCTFKHQTALKVQNYVGVIQTPCGVLIEILPKLKAEGKDSEEVVRDQLITMLRCLRNSPFKEADYADIRDTSMPLLEVYISQFLALTNKLLKRGIRSDYVRKQKSAAYLKGRLLVSQQIRQHVTHPERFLIECDEYLVNRPANRLIKLTLELSKRASQSFKNLRLAKELSLAFEEVPISVNVQADFQKVKFSRSMKYYQEVLSWCHLLLNGQGPTASAGKINTLSMLYPMERIFEDYVAHCLKSNLSDYFGEGATLKTQVSKQSLVEEHNDSTIFKLRPDLAVVKDSRLVCVMDTKWKLIDASNRRAKYGISQADMYQLYAYGHKYLKEQASKELMLIYPKSECFFEPLPSFKYEDGLTLKVVPFDLSSGTLCT